jgi:hypothetical protein
MLSLNLPQILILGPRLAPLMRRAHKKKACPAQKGGLKSAGPCQNRIAGATPRRASMRFLSAQMPVFARYFHIFGTPGSRTHAIAPVSAGIGDNQIRRPAGGGERSERVTS